jgi:hypothetical protein
MGSVSMCIWVCSLYEIRTLGFRNEEPGADEHGVAEAGEDEVGTKDLRLAVCHSCKAGIDKLTHIRRGQR